MIEKYLEERKDILSQIIRNNKEKFEHNQIAILESKKQISELDETIDEASQIFSVKAREDNGFKNQEICDLESRIASYVIENEEYKQNIDAAQSELNIINKCLDELNVSRETCETKIINDDVEEKQLEFDDSLSEPNKNVENQKIISKLEFCKNIAEIDTKRVVIEINNIINMMK